MKVTNNSDAKISDVEILEIVKDDVRINLLNNTTEIIVGSDLCVILVKDIWAPDFVRVGYLNKRMRWGIE